MESQNKLKNFILKLQGFSELKKKIIFFSIMSVATIGMLIFAFSFTKSRFPIIASSAQSLTFSSFNMFEGDSAQDLVDSNYQGNTNFGTTDEYDGVNSEAVDQFVEWKTYQNAEKGFSVNHPEDMQVVPSDTKFSGIKLLQLGVNVEDPGVINVCPKDCSKEVVDMSQSELVLESSPVVIDGVSAKVYSRQKDNFFEYFIYFLESPTKKFNVFNASNSSKGGWIAVRLQSEAEAQQVMESFKFIP